MPKYVKVREKLPHSHDKYIIELEKIAVELRELVVEMLEHAKSGHSAGAIGTAEIFAVLFFHFMNIDPKNSKDPNRDKFILSNGHICPILYATLAKMEIITKKDLWTLRKINSNLQGHPHKDSLPFIDNTSGPLGQGLSQANGIAFAAKMDARTKRIYCMVSDGELNEGQNWEALLFAAKYNLHNLTLIIDRNNIQIDGFTEDVMPLENLSDKLEAFGWYVIEINGHNVEEIINALNMAKTIAQRPTAIIAHTIPGYGIDFMEYKFEWHGKPPKNEEASSALKQLRTLDGKIENEYE